MGPGIRVKVRVVAGVPVGLGVRSLGVGPGIRVGVRVVAGVPVGFGIPSWLPTVAHEAGGAHPHLG